MLHLSLANLAAYGEMGAVDASNCLCFVGFAVNSLMEDDDLKCTGCGCESDKVNDIVTELKRRQAFRGDRAKVRMGEATLASLEQLNTKVRSIVPKLLSLISTFYATNSVLTCCILRTLHMCTFIG